MNRRTHALVLVIALAAAGAAMAADRVVTERMTRTTTLAFDGSFYIDNPAGSIEILGTEKAQVEVTILKVVKAADDASARKGIQQTQIYIGGDAKKRVIRTILVAGKRNWTPAVHYTIRLPRTVHVTIGGNMAERIRVQNIAGNVVVKSVTGEIAVGAVTGPLQIDTVNGTISVRFDTRPRANVSLSSINGRVELYVPADSSFDYYAETLQGDILTSVPLRGGFLRGKSGKAFRGVLNSGGGASIRMVSFTGRVYVLGNGSPLAAARSMTAEAQRVAKASGLRTDTRQKLASLVNSGLLLDAPSASQFVLQQSDVTGDFKFETSLGNVFVGHVRHNASVTTRGGEITLGMVGGDCSAISYGGPINLGDVGGSLDARTSGGDVNVRAARKGGMVSTEGGNVEVMYAGGPITLFSGGGDIVLREARASVRAEARSGDIAVAVDPMIRAARIDLNASAGNVVLSVSPAFAADIEVVIVTSSDDANHIVSDIPGLSIIKERVGNRTVIRAVGKVNGGGEKVSLRAEFGDIHIRTRPVRQIATSPRR